MALRPIIPRPGDVQGDGNDWKVDIVAVHGLNPWGKAIDEHARNTWTRPEGKDGYLWLQEDLPKQCPQARVFIYEYDSNLVFTQNKESFVHKANDFLEALRTKRKSSPLRPLILLGHSLGGILIKQALANAHKNPDYLPIKEATVGLMFFGTPHKGGNGTLVALGSLAARIATHLGFRERSDIVSALKDGSTFSDILQESFRHQLESYQIVSFYEKIGNVVPMHSAVLGLPGHRERILGIDADHSNICRFDPTRNQTERDNMDKVISNVDDLFRLAVARDRSARTGIPYDDKLSKNKRKILKWLYKCDHADDHESDLLRHHAMDETCQWLLQRDEFQSWLSDPDSSVLWINGIPGSGKSFLAAFTVQHLRRRHSRVLHYFCNERYDETRLTVKAVSCLLYQMLLLDDNLLDVLAPFHDKATQKRLSCLEISREIFKASIAAFGPAFVVIDALDECVDRKNLIEILGKVSDIVPEGWKIVATSRDEIDIRRTFSMNGKISELQIREDDIAGDVKTFVRGLVSESSELSSKLEEHADLRREIVRRLTLAAQGMFLLPKFMVVDLETKATVEEIHECLSDLPTDLDSYYASTLARMDARRRKFARKVLTWVLRTRRPLSLAELTAAISLDGSRYLRPEVDIKSSCGCLVKTDNDRVRLSHNTVKQFLLESAVFQNNPLRADYIDEDGLEHIADACSKFIFYHRFRKPLSRAARFGLSDLEDIRKAYPLLEYACIHWIYHCRISKSPARFLPQIDSFLSSPQLSIWYEAVATFNIYEGFPMVFDHLQQWFLSLRLPTNRVIHKYAEIAVSIAGKISRLWEFIEKWELALRAFPAEIHSVDCSITSLSTPSHSRKQQHLLTSDDMKERERRSYNMVDGQFIGYGVDRFLLGATSIFSWNSLMQSEVWDNSLNHQITPEKPERMRLNVQNMFSHCVEPRQGLALAAVGRLTAHATLRKDLQAVAVVWACYSRDMAQAPIIKSYAWYVRPDTLSIMLQRIDWTCHEEDPCRVDLTQTLSFQGSRAAVAFSRDGQTLWTPGGAYNLETGAKEYPPSIFDDPHLSALTFSRDATAVAGVREGSGLEIYAVQGATIIATAPGPTEIVGMSPYGAFCLYLCSSFGNGSLSGKGIPGGRDISQEVWLLCSRSGLPQRIWGPYSNNERRGDMQQTSPLSHFYNNGGLFAFSENETVLVLCVPAQPLWKILAYDLQEPGIAATMWNVDCSDVLMNTNLMCLTFCPFHERRLYLLNHLGIMRACQISRKETTSSASIVTTRQEDSTPVLSGIIRASNSAQLVVLEFSEDELQLNSWDLHTLKKTPNALCSLPFLRAVANINSENLWIDLDPILTLGTLPSIYRWGQLVNISMMNTLQEVIMKNVATARSFFLSEEVSNGDEEGSTHADDKLEEKARSERQGNLDDQSKIVGLRESEASDVSIAQAKANNEGNQDDKQQEIKKGEGDDHIQTKCSVQISFSAECELMFAAYLVTISEPIAKTGNIASQLSVLVSIIDLNSGRRKITGELRAARIGNPIRENLIVEYEPENKVLAFALSVEYSEKLDTGNYWRLGYLYICPLSTPLAVDSQPDKAVLEITKFRLDHGFTNMIFSKCGRYIFGTSTWYNTFVAQVDTWRIEDTRVINVPSYIPGSVGDFSQAKCLSLSFWNDHLMLVGNCGPIVAAFRFNMDERASYETATIAVAPALVESTSAFKAIWPDGGKGGFITLISQNKNQIRRDGEIRGDLTWPFVLKVARSDIGMWSETVVEPEKFTENDFPRRYPLAIVFD